MVNFHVLVIYAALLFSAVHARPRKGLVTLYSKGSESAGGVFLHKYPLCLKTSKGKCKMLYPVAVYTPMVKNLKYSIVKIKVGKKSIWGHIVDECPRNSGSCNANQKKAGRKGAILLDVYKSAWPSLGISLSKGIYDAKVSFITKRSRKSKLTRRVLTPDGKRAWLDKSWQ